MIIIESAATAVSSNIMNEEISMTTQIIKFKAAMAWAVNQPLCSDENFMQKAGAQPITAGCRLQ